MTREDEQKAVMEILRGIPARDPKTAKASELIQAYHAECNEILGQRMTPAAMQGEIDKAHTRYYARMVNLVDPLITEEDNLALSLTVPVPSNLTAADYRAALVRIVNAWRRCRPLGFVKGGPGDPVELVKAVASAAQLVDPPAVDPTV